MQQIDDFKGGQNLGLQSASVFGFAFVGLTILSAFLIGSFPLSASIVTIFLFAGVHNFFEFRYFIARMPLKWGKSKGFYLFGIGGTLILTTIYLIIYFGSGNWLWSLTDSAILVSTWNTIFVLWLAGLVYLRGKHRRKDWSLAFAIGFLISAFVWLFPNYWSLSLVYLHPFVAMWFLERQIRRTKPEWLRIYHYCLMTIPFFVISLWFAFANQPNLSQETQLFWRISQHAGSGILTNISSHFLVATHVFLETIHYAVWILLIPLVDFRAIPWKLNQIPMFAKEKGFPGILIGIFSVSLLLVFALWFGFVTDYSFTRDLYFAFAMAHVLAEMPFLIKML
jgi:hypothetical protein